MAVSMALGGFSAAEADELRRTMGHMRKKGRLVSVLEKLEARMIANEVAPDIAHQICEDLELRQLWIPRVARVELCADSVRDGVAQDAPPDGVLLRHPQRVAHGLLLAGDVDP